MHFPKGKPKEVMAEWDCPLGRVLFHADGTGKLLTREGEEEALSKKVSMVLVFAAKAIDDAQKLIAAQMVGNLLKGLAQPCDDPNCPGCVARREAQQPKAPRREMFGFGTQN